MKTKTKKPLVPRLRFKDKNWQDFPEWEEKRLKDMLLLIVDNRGKTPPTEKNGIPLIEVNAFLNKKVDYSRIKKFVSEKTFSTWFRQSLKDKDILFCTVGATAKIAFYSHDVKAAIAQNIVGFRFKKEDPDFMFYLLSVKKNIHKFKRIEMGAVQPSVKVSQMVKIYFEVPEKEEQQKIASFLSAVDDWIENLRKQKESLEKYKNGMMQKIFSQEIRFKDDNGQEFPEWEEKKLKSVFIRKTKKNNDNKINFVLTNSATEGIVSQSNYFDRDIANQNNLTNYYVVEIEDFVYNPRISLHAPVGPMKMNTLRTGFI